MIPGHFLDARLWPEVYFDRQREESPATRLELTLRATDPRLNRGRDRFTFLSLFKFYEAAVTDYFAEVPSLDVVVALEPHKCRPLVLVFVALQHADHLALQLVVIPNGKHNLYLVTDQVAFTSKVSLAHQELAWPTLLKLSLQRPVDVVLVERHGVRAAAQRTGVPRRALEHSEAANAIMVLAR